MVAIRHAIRDDYTQLPAIEADAASLFYDFGAVLDGHESLPIGFYERLSPKAAVFVATEFEQLVGFAVGLVADGQAHLKEVSVKRQFARKGIGRLLVQRITEWARYGQYQWLTLTTFRDLPFNAPFYRRLGFQEFEPDGDWTELRAMREHEKNQGLEAMPRVAMRLAL